MTLDFAKEKNGVAASGEMFGRVMVDSGIRCIRARIFNSTGTRKVNDVTSDFTKRAVLAERDGSYTIRAGNLHTRRSIMD